MELSRQWLTDVRTVAVGPNSTVIAGANRKRRRLTIYPLSAVPVFLNPNGPATPNGGAAVLNGNAPVVYGDGDTPGIVDQGVQGCTAGGTTFVSVVDEFLG